MNDLIRLLEEYSLAAASLLIMLLWLLTPYGLYDRMGILVSLFYIIGITTFLWLSRKKLSFLNTNARLISFVIAILVSNFVLDKIISVLVENNPISSNYITSIIISVTIVALYKIEIKNKPLALVCIIIGLIFCSYFLKKSAFLASEGMMLSQKGYSLGDRMEKIRVYFSMIAALHLLPYCLLTYFNDDIKKPDNV